jgi:hypothetical protein
MEVAEITEYDGALVDFDQEEEAAGAIYTALSTENGIWCVVQDKKGAIPTTSFS